MVRTSSPAPCWTDVGLRVRAQTSGRGHLRGSTRVAMTVGVHQMSGAVLGGRARVASTSVAAVGALVASTVVVLGASDAAFTASTANPGNSWETGSIVIASLTDDDSGTTPATGTAMFSETGLQPGDTGENCITVTSNVGG